MISNRLENGADLGAWRVLARLLELHELTPARASAELRRVHEIEVARLLREAAVLRARTSELGELFIVESYRVTEASWRSRATREIAMSRLDDAPASDLLIRLTAEEFAAWPAASAIAVVALSIVAGFEGRLCLSSARLAEGDVDGARKSLEELIAREPCAIVPARSRALSAAALAAQAQGERSAALERFTASSALPRSDLDPLVSALALALRCADGDRARVAFARLQRLDLHVEGVRRRWNRAVERTRARTQWERARGRVILARPGARLAADLARESPSVVGPVIDALS